MTTVLTLKSYLIHALRLVQDNSGRLVPAGVAKARMYSQSLGLDDYRELDVPTRTRHQLAAFTELAGVRRVDPPEFLTGDFVRRADKTISCNGEKMNITKRGVAGRLIPGKASALCAGGQLHPGTIATTSPRKARPARRCTFEIVLSILCSKAHVGKVSC